MLTPSRPPLPGVWPAAELDGAVRAVRRSGHAALDAQLPGGGWPLGALTEVLQAQPGLHEWRLLLPAVRDAAREGTVLLLGVPHLPGLAALAAQDLPPGTLLRVEADRPADRLWAAEQALRCEAVTVLLAWLPQARPEQLRRLHLAAQAREGAGAGPLFFAFRPAAARHESSAAPLRLALRHASDGRLELDLFKRRGPVLDAPLLIEAPAPVHLALRRRAARSADAIGAPAADRRRPRSAPSRPVRDLPTVEVAPPSAADLVSFPVIDHVVDRPGPPEPVDAPPRLAA